MGDHQTEYLVIALVLFGIGGFRVLWSRVFANSHREAKIKTEYAARSQGWNIVRILSSINIFKNHDEK